jgi:ferrous iron transport protein B
VDATNLRLHLRFVLELRRLGLPMVVVLNMSDAAERRGIKIDRDALSRTWRAGGANRRGQARRRRIAAQAVRRHAAAGAAGQPLDSVSELDTHAEVKRLLDVAVTMPTRTAQFDDALDRVVLHPVFGLADPGGAAVLHVPGRVLVGRAADGRHRGRRALVRRTGRHDLPDGMLKSLLVDGIIAGLGSVIVFLPQILILFLFILTLEESGYLPRAAFLLDRLMMGAGLSGRSFIPCCPASPARFPASWPRARSRTRATA